VVTDRGTDVIIVGRAIYEARDPIAAARAFCDQGWQAYQARVAKHGGTSVPDRVSSSSSLPSRL
jgi:thiazole synthase ThiGH ThiG subunit